MHPKRKNQNGSAFLLTLFFSTLFVMMFGATLSLILVQNKAIQQQIQKTQALHIAEAGTQYFRWQLAHNPTDFITGTGTSSFTDPLGGPFGSYTISVQAPETGSTITEITAEGKTEQNNAVSSRVRTYYGKPALSHYAFLTNSNVWFGETEKISGEIHSNGGIRMDGIGDSVISSAQETYTCGAEHGCNNEEKNGVWGTGEISSLWQYPNEAIDFTSIILELNSIKTDAQIDGIYLGDSGAHGYFVEFSEAGTVTINTVTSLETPVYGYDGTEWQYESNSKATWTPIPGYENIPLPNNGLIFLADNVWVAGTVNGRVTVTAARLPEGSAPPADIYIQENITYSPNATNPTLALIAQEDILIPLYANNTLEIDGALMAVGGHTYRYYYPAWSSEPYATYAVRDTIKTFGALISNTTWTWSWVSCTDCPVVSGFSTTETAYDPKLTFTPPPSFPTEDEYTFIAWEELKPNEE